MTHGQSYKPYDLIIQDDRNLVLYDKYARPLWPSNRNI